ncbi:MAG: hypothetical protein QM756_32260 [Polyangiaceae bacterium]
MDPAHFDKMSRDELVAKARSLGVERAELMTRVELGDEIVRRTQSDPAAQQRARGWLGVARDLVASVVGTGLSLPDAAALIRGERGVLDLKGPSPVATVTLAEIYATQGHSERALSMLDEVLAGEPDHVAALALRERLTSGGRPRRPEAQAEAPTSDAEPAISQVLETASLPSEPPTFQREAGTFQDAAPAFQAELAEPASEPDTTQQLEPPLPAEPLAYPPEPALLEPEPVLPEPEPAAPAPEPLPPEPEPAAPDLVAAPFEAVAVQFAPEPALPAEIVDEAPVAMRVAPIEQPLPALAPDVPTRPDASADALPIVALASEPEPEAEVVPTLLPPPMLEVSVEPTLVVLRQPRAEPVLCWDLPAFDANAAEPLEVECHAFSASATGARRAALSLSLTSAQGSRTLTGFASATAIRAAVGRRRDGVFVPLAIASELVLEGGTLGVRFRPPLQEGAPPNATEQRLVEQFGA